MKRILLTLIFLFIIPVFAQDMVLKAGVSVEDVPKALYGSWRVSAKLDDTNSKATFKPQSVDFWNLSRVGDKIILDNPFSGANADVSVSTVEGNLVVFSKRLPYDNNKVLIDTVTLRLKGNSFSGINSLTLESYSLVDNHLMKTEYARYLIEGEKIAGDTVIKGE